MSRKAILAKFQKANGNREYNHRSLLLNIDIDTSNHFQFSLFNCGKNDLERK